tara:strand:+ start:152762 stop:153142 length:381 start_codon:yes stop_codon:yes gene_type:complete
MRRVFLAFTFLIILLNTSCGQDQQDSILYSSFQIYSYLEDQVNIIEWNGLEEINSSYYVIEKKTENHDFEPIGTVDVTESSNSYKEYYFEDYSTSPTIKPQYRLTLVHMDGTRISWIVNANIKRSK